ncbi:hypothetical protein Q4601_18650 [Shewanella sp. 1_MG-2023]|uniref:hypothetical protein n=2 Tax=Shewanella TaxID=22 RepID=UPI000C829083|nr:hypothetical protein [Shewanella sp. 2_MG-2023]MDO6613687.1 hypothetical protein [Shewanella sp. 7_MG-2023]MDO6773457.1 hypothetical protein [Shewanella sp. 2_MG-2023]MDO6796317.1 hypothetical protein [Shewanella sp. 1_MG-2023]PMG79185.1 hypothetical protein BCU84_05970 [Shewanella sp. 10N.286.51.B7]
MMKNWIMSVLGQQPNRKRTKIEVDLRFEKQSFLPENNSLAEETDAAKSAAELDSNIHQFKSPNIK